MMKSLTTTLLLLSISTLVCAYGEPDLAHEHAGGIFNKVRSARGSGEVIHNGQPKGTNVTINSETVYVARPPAASCDNTSTAAAVLYLTDIFGNALINNQLLADSIAHAGYTVFMPDLFRNDPVPSDALSNPTSTFNLTAWRARHPQSSIDAIIATTLAAIHTGSDLPPPLSPTPHVGGVGYCFGGKYIARFLASAPPGNHALSAGFTAHPSAVLASEWSAVAAPISIAFGELDASNTAENRTAIEQIFGERNATFQTALYAAAEHGFAVRTDRSDRKKAFAQEAAYLQAVRWLDAWVRDGDEEVDL